MRSFSPSALSFLQTLFFFFITTLKPTTAQFNPNPILTSSFTWNPNCGPTVACGPSAAGYHGTGFAASNNLTYAGCTNLGDDSVDCSAASIVSGVGKGCGQCWHITPQSDWYKSNGRSVGTSVVVKINDQCTDPGYCDQTESHPVNTGYGKEVHIDLCAESGVTGQFFGAVGPGVVVGLAQLLPDCSALDDGPYGSSLESLDGSSSAASSSSSSSGSASSSSGSASSASSGSESSSSSASESSSSSVSESNSSSGDSSSTSESSSSSSSGGDSSSSSLGSEPSSSPDSGSSSSAESYSSSSSGDDSAASPGGDASSSSGSASSSSSSGSGSPSDSVSDSSSNSDSSSSPKSESDPLSKSANAPSSNTPSEPLTPGTISTGSGNWTWSGYGTKTAKHKLSSGHDGQKAGANVINGVSNAESNIGGTSSSSFVAPPAPTTLVAVVSSSIAPEAVGSSTPGIDSSGPEDDGGDDDECDDDDGEDEGVSEL